MDTISDILPFIIPVGIIHLILVVLSLRDIFKYSQLMLIGKIIWTILVIYVVITGPFIYLLHGRGERSWSKKITELQQHALEEAREKDKANS